MAESLLRRLPAGPVTEAMFAALLDQLRVTPAEERRKLADHATLQIRTAAPLTQEQRDRYARALGEVLASTPTFEFIVDPALLAGFELHGQSLTVLNSWRSDLDAMLLKLREARNGQRS